jgi:hypothetical protein
MLRWPSVRHPSSSRRVMGTRGTVEVLESRRLLAAWYVSTGGDNDNPGTLEEPFKTIQQAATVAEPGDTVFVREGVYRETITPASSGEAGSPITFQPYNDEEVVVSGADPVTGWAPGDNNVYSAPMDWTRGTGDDQVFVDGQMMIYARYPNTSLNVSRPTKLTSTSGSGSSDNGVTTGRVFNSALSQPNGFWEGATVHIAAGAGFVQHTATVTSSVTGAVTFTYGTENESVPRFGNHFYIDNTFKALDAPGEWYRDPATDTLHLRTPHSDDPSVHRVEAKRRDLAFDLRGVSHVEVKGINLFAASITTDDDSHHVTIDGIKARYVSHYNMVKVNAWIAGAWDTGIILRGSNNEIRNSDIAFSAGNGILLAGSDNRALNNSVRDVNYAATDAAGITTGLTNETAYRAEIGHNTVYNAGRSLIVFRNLKGGKIHHNEVYEPGLQTNDFGGLYTHGLDGEGTEISYNKIHDIYGGVPGVGGHGLYFDNWTSNFMVHHNLVYNTSNALLLNTPGENQLVYNNTLLGSTSVTSWPTAEMPGTALKNNIYSGVVHIDPSVVQQNNITWQTDPKFVNAAAGDYRLQAISPGIDAGQKLAPYTDGYVGAAPDIGAFEYGVVPWQAGPVGSSAPLPPPVPPSAASAEPLTDTQILVTWTDNTTTEQGFTVERSSDGTTFRTAGLVGSDVTSFVDTNLNPTTKYTYRVKADTSGYSNLTAATTKRGATSAIHAKTADASEGLVNDGFGLGSLDQNDWALFREVNFGAGVSDIGIRIGVPSDAAGKQVEVRVDSLDGPLLGTLTTSATGGYSQMITQWTPVSHSVTGWHDVYVVFKGGWGIGYLGSVVFRRAATLPLQAENYDDMRGVAKDDSGIGSLDIGDWVRYGNVDFSSNPNRFIATIGVPDEHAGSKVEVRVGAPTGQLIATLTVAATGSFSNVTQQSTWITAPAYGIQSVYLVFPHGWGVGYLDSFSFKRQTISPIKQEAENYQSMSGVANDGHGLGSLDHGDWAYYGAIDFGAGGITWFTAEIGVPEEHAGKQIEVRSGSPEGTVLAILTVEATGAFGLTAEQTAYAATPLLVGLQDIYLVFKGGWGVGYLDSFTFS